MIKEKRINYLIEEVRGQNWMYRDDIESIAEILNKQIPKRPKKQINGNWFMCQECGEWMSPSCKKNSLYCDQCGQAIDWSEED